MPDIVTYIDSIPNEIWSGLLGALIAGVMASLSTDKANKHNLAILKLQHANEERLNSQRIAKERLEELYVLVGQWHEYLQLSSIKLREVLASNGDLKAYKDALESDRTGRPDYERMEMIIKIYGEEAQHYYVEAEGKRDVINHIYINYKRSDPSNLNGAAFLEPLRAATLEFREAVIELKDCIAKIAGSV